MTPFHRSGSRRVLLKQALALGLGGSAAVRAAVAANQRWQLNGARVLDAGRSHELAEGLFHDGYQLEATATLLGTGVLSQALFSLSGQAFSPAQTIGAQVAGRWYVRGLWTLTEPDAAGQVPAVGRHQPGALRGQFSAELPGNPLLSPMDWRAELRVPSGRYTPIDPSQAVQPIRGDGALTMNAALDGVLTLNLRTQLRG